MNVFYNPEQQTVPVKCWTDDIEPAARQQLLNCATLPFIHKHVAAMPDVHWGMGATVGSVIPTLKAVIPAAVGVDIGCGMTAVRLDLHADQLPDNLHHVRTAIEAAIPHGRTDNGGVNDRGSWSHPPSDILAWCTKPGNNFFNSDINDRHPSLLKGNVRFESHMGTLGTGNHFIELCLDEIDRVWIMLHSGSRGIGNRIGTYFISKAKEEMERWHITLPDANLAYLPAGSQYFTDYCRAVAWAQHFAAANRDFMRNRTLAAVRQALGLGLIGYTTDEAINCHHNYVSIENHYGQNVFITRKGAIRAREGDLGIIPGSMGTRSYIVRGKGNPESFHSCSHGAGRRMSRTQARKEQTAERFNTETAGIECRKDEGVWDEAPSAYKDIDEVMRNQHDLVDIVHTLRQIVCVKG